jgi:hypothetical protein
MISFTAGEELMDQGDLSSKQVALALGGVFFLNLLLRGFYLRYQFVNGDEAVRALTAVRLLEGARLYLDVVTDKPPAATLFYASVFLLFGRSMKAVHVVAAWWNFATALVIYFTAARFWQKRVGLWAALSFTYFSASYLTQDMMAANTELLMVLPYTASFYFYLRARRARAATSSLLPANWLLLLLSGLLTGLASMFKQVGVFNLAFFALYEFFSRSDRQIARSLLESARRLLLIGLGVGIVLLLLAAWLIHTGALGAFWRNAIQLGAFYIGSLPRDLWIKFMLSRTAGYVLFNLPLWSLAALAVASGGGRSFRANSAGETCPRFAVALWAAVSLSGVFTSGRFYGHYFIASLPALAMLAALGIEALRDRRVNPARKRASQAAAYLLIFAFVFNLVRFHHRTAILAYETITGTRTRWSERWGMTKREREAEQIAQFLRQQLGAGEPIFIWGYALDVYWRSGCRPASRYLTPYYVTGHFYPEVTTTEEKQGERFWREARAQLIDDLKRSRPKLILNLDEAIWSLPYPEIVEFIKSEYQYEGQIGSDPLRPFLVFRLKDNLVIGR